VDILSVTDWLCDDAGCPLVRDPYLVYRDSHHLTATFAERLSGQLGAALGALMGDDLVRD
jgi:hypothetical protein